jgi:hypothetical protein
MVAAKNEKKITYSGQSRTLGDWCNILNLDYQKTYTRLERGWSTADAFDRKNPYLPDK